LRSADTSSISMANVAALKQNAVDQAAK